MAVGSAQALLVRLVASHGEQLRRFLSARARSKADVADIVQEVYLRMLRVPDIDSIRSPEAYLFTVAKHVVQQHSLRHSKQLAPDAVVSLYPPRLAGLESDPALELDAHECLVQLQRAFEGLSPKARATFILHRRDGLSLDEIAIRLGISRPMTKKYLANALMQLRQQLLEPK